MGKVKCFNCKKTGHYDRDCTQPKKDEKESFFSFCIVGQETKEEATMSGCAFCKTDFNEHVASRCSNNVRVKKQAEAEASVGQTRKWDGQVTSWDINNKDNKIKQANEVGPANVKRLGKEDKLPDAAKLARLGQGSTNTEISESDMIARVSDRP